MKIDVDYEELHQGIRKLKEGKELSKNEKEALIELINATEGDYYPSEEEYEMQISRVKRLNEIDYDKQPELHQRILDRCTEFENKFM